MGRLWATATAVMGATERSPLMEAVHRLESGSQQGGWWAWVRSMDAFPKFETAYLRHTSTGGLGSVACFGLMALLMGVEVWRWAVPMAAHEFRVDSERLQADLPLDFSISLASPCHSTCAERATLLTAA